jgi:glutaredoxin
MQHVLDKGNLDQEERSVPSENRPTEKEIVMYTRGGFCPDVSRARRAFQLWKLPYREINVRDDREAHQLCLDWNGCLAMPVIVIARLGEDLPIEPPSPLEPGQSPRDVDRGYMISEAGKKRLHDFLERHGFLAPTDE